MEVHQPASSRRRAYLARGAVRIGGPVQVQPLLQRVQLVPRRLDEAAPRLQIGLAQTKLLLVLLDDACSAVKEVAEEGSGRKD